MDKLDKKLELVCGLMEKLAKIADEELCKGKEHVCTKEMGEVVDMIKDLAKAEKSLTKACYYYKITEAMEETKEEEELMDKVFRKMNSGEELSDHERMGYDRWRYSSGRFAPKGRGRRTGYTPWGPPTYVDGTMGYEPDEMTTYADGRMGYPTAPRHMDNFRMARKNYTATRSIEDKDEMNEHAKHHLRESMDSMKEIWKSADPELKNKMKNDLSSLLKEMS